MQRLNLSEWAITHRALVLFMILLLSAAGTYSYFNLGRAEDPSFTIKVMVVNVQWPGATATEMQTQVADKIEKKLQELPYLDRVESYSQPGVSFIRVILSDRTPPAKVKDLWYQVRKKIGDIRGSLPGGIIGPNFNDEYGDVYSALYMLTADGLTLAELKSRAEDIRQRLLRVPDVNKVDIIGERPERIFIEFSHTKLATLGLTPQQIFESVTKQNAVTAGGSVDTASDRINLRVTGAFAGVEAIAAVPVQANGQRLPAGRHRHSQARLRGSAELPHPHRGQACARARRLDAGRRQHRHARRKPENRDAGDHVRAAARHRDHADRRPAADRRTFGLGFPAQLRRSARYRAGREPFVTRMAHRHRGGAIGAARARDRVRRHVRVGHGSPSHHAWRAHHRARAAG